MLSCFCCASILFCFSVTESYCYAPKIIERIENNAHKDNILSGRAYIKCKTNINDVINYNSSQGGINFTIIKPILNENAAISFYYNKIKTKGIESLLNSAPNHFVRSIINKIETLPESKLQKIIKAEVPLLKTYLISFADSISPEKFCYMLKSKNPFVEYAEPYIVDEVQGEFIPNDSLVKDQKMLKTMQAFEAWNVYQGDSTVAVGISDTGVFIDHEDLKDAVFINRNEIPDNGIDDDGNGYVDDYKGVNFVWQDDGSSPGSPYNAHAGHGTGTAGIAGARVNNQKGIAGVGYNVKIFPMKTTLETGDGIVYGYESLMYAAQNGIKVVNCSWGSTTYSSTSENIINYAIANDVSIVAAAGNNGNTAAFYPAAYPGVLGVGVTDPEDSLVPMSGLGSHVDIMAPGQESITTGNFGSYGSFCCTSGAAPIVSAAVGLVRSRHPELDAIQALEFTRQAVDDIRPLNPKAAKILPGRINLLKAVSMSPDSTPSISPVETIITDLNNVKRNRYLINDTLILRINCINYLGEAKNCTFTLSTLGDSLNSIILLDSTWEKNLIAKNEFFQTGAYRFVINNINTQRPFFKIDISADKYKDFFLIPFTPTSTYTTFSNDSLDFTAADNGRIGFNDPPNDNQGIGFNYKPYGNMLFEGGVIASNAQGFLVSQYRNPSTNQSNDFASVKPYVAPDENRAVFNDGFADDTSKIGIEVENIIKLPDNMPCSVMNIKVTNIGTHLLDSLAIAYMMDWDLSYNSNKDYVSLFDTAIPDTKKSSANRAIIIRSMLPAPKVGIAVLSDQPNSFAQIAGFDNMVNNRYGSVSKEDKLMFLSSGVNIFTNSVTDIAISAGIRFYDYIFPDDYREFKICTCSAYDENKLRDYLRILADSTFNGIRYTDSQNNLEITPNPASDFINILSKNYNIRQISIINSLGITVINDVINSETDDTNQNNFTINLTGLPSGVYYAVINDYQGLVMTKKFAIVR